MRKIFDQFSDVASRQKRWALRRRADGLCIICGRPAEPSERDPSKKICYCLEHKIQHREHQRRRLANQKGRLTAASKWASKRAKVPKARRDTVHLRNAGGKPFCGYAGTRMSENWAEITCEICWRLWHKGKPA